MVMKCMFHGAVAVIVLSEKKGKEIITIPKHKPIKKVYIKLVKDVVESEAER